MKTRKSFTFVELLVVMCITAVLASVSFVGITSFMDNSALAEDSKVVEQMNDVLQYSTKGNKTENVAQVYRIVRTVYQAPESEGLFYVWDKNINRVIMVDNDKCVYNYDIDGSTNVGNWYYIDGSNAKLVSEGKSIDYNDLFKTSSEQVVSPE